MTGIKAYHELEPEHRLQVELLDALLVAVQGGRDDDQVDELLQRLRDISEAHFLSEDLLMRLHAYPDHADHVAEHEIMTKLLDDLRAAESAPDAGKLVALRNRYVNHIHEKDAKFEAFLEAPGRNDDLNSPSV
jgi:hemerythrin